MAGGRVISAVLTLKDKNFSSTAQKSASAMTDFQRKTQHSANAVKNFSKSASVGFKSVAKGAASIAGAIGITQAFNGAVGMVKGSITSAFDRIDTMESFKQTMTVLTGSTEKASAALEKTRDAVTGTGYGLDTAAKGVQNFVTRGMDIDKATDSMAAWGDAVAFYGDGSNDQLATVSDALGKMYSSGKVGADQLNRLIDVGINSVEMYATATGKSTPEVEKAFSKGKISAEDFINVVETAMMEGTNGVTKIAGAAKEAGSSWSNTFSNMRAAVTRGVEDIIMKTDELLVSNGLPDMRSMVVVFGEKFEGVLKDAADKIPVVTDFLVGMYERAKPGLDWIKDTAFPAIQDAFQFATDKARDMYDFITGNWGAIGPVVGGVAGAIGAFRLGVVAVTAAQATWAAVTKLADFAAKGLNTTLKLSPMGWVALGIGVVIAAGIALYQNWDTVKEKAQGLWDKMKAVGEGIQIAFSMAFDIVKSAAETSINFVIGKINDLIGVINLIPGVNVPIIAKVDYTSASAAASKTGGGSSSSGSSSGGSRSAVASYDVGTNRVPKDMFANIHKDEMIIPARQSENLRRQGVTIDNIDKGALNQSGSVRVASVNQSTSNDGVLALLTQLLQAIKDMPKGDVVININGSNLTVQEIINELVPLLKLRLANM